MAENESLDLWSRDSRRWRGLLDRIRDAQPIEDVARETVRCVYATFKNLTRLLPVPEILKRVPSGPAAVREIIQGQQKARDYAELYVQQVAISSDPADVVAGVARAALDRFLDQIEMEVVPTNSCPDRARFRALRNEIHARLAPAVDRLARSVAAAPSDPPRMPARSSEQKRNDQADLLRLSVKRNKSRAYG